MKRLTTYLSYVFFGNHVKSGRLVFNIVLKGETGSIACYASNDLKPASAPTSFLLSLFEVSADILTIIADETFFTPPGFSVTDRSVLLCD
jgi:hypothetical protein